MSTYVARLEWVGIDIASKASESGQLLVRAEDVVITRKEVTKANRALTQRMVAFEGAFPSPDEIAKIMAEVNSDPAANEVAEVWYIKSLQLSGGFHLSYSEHPQMAELSGFGLSGGIGELEREREGCGLTFSWDWFHVVSPGRADKLQEDGTISYEQQQTPCGNEITHMVFDTDIAVRIARRGASDPRIPDWRLNIRKGSEIFWPSLIDGQIVPNGSLS